MNRVRAIAIVCALGLVGCAPLAGQESAAVVYPGIQHEVHENLIEPQVSAPISSTGFQGEAIEHFLEQAAIVRDRLLSEGVTAPHRLTLERDGATHDAVFKDIELLKRGVTRLDDGMTVVNMEDNWRFEVAAYRIDRLIGLGMVPATVPRTHRDSRGSLQWWVDSEMSEAERQATDRLPPTARVASWSRQWFNMRLFDALIYNWDRHTRNILITADFDLRLIDHSRAFVTYEYLPNEDLLTNFSRRLLAGLEQLNRSMLVEQVGSFIEASKIDAILARRDRILELADERVAEAGGEDAVLYP